MFKYFTIGKWVGFIIALLLLVLTFVFFSLSKKATKKDDKIGFKVLSIISVIIGIIVLASIIIDANTESGKRAYKDQQSEFNDGIVRVVSVYDMEGDLIAQYTGKFDIENRDGSILFDDENGKRHIIYYSTGTIIVDEK